MAILNLHLQQRQSIHDLSMLSMDYTYENQDKQRRNQQEPMWKLENSVISEHLGRDSKRIDELRRSFARLEQQTVWSIEIDDTNHNKAIFIFGVVTLVFLPLSFFTSYFGMNTADIRDTESGQGDFWKVALPISAGVVGLTIIVAYYGEAIREWLSSQHEPSHTAALATGLGTGSGYPSGRADTIFPPPAAAPEIVAIRSKQPARDRANASDGTSQDDAPDSFRNKSQTIRRIASPSRRLQVRRAASDSTLEEDQIEDGDELNDEYEGEDEQE